MKILTLTNLYPPHHAGTNDFRCQTIVENLRTRGHQVQVLTSKHGMTAQQTGGDVERRLILNGAFDHALVSSYREMLEIEETNNRALNEAIASFQPELVHVFSLEGLSKSLMFTLRHSRLPTVYDIAAPWLSEGVKKDPWLRWWNQTHPSFSENMARSALELSGKRNAFDETAPTRLMKGYERLPQLYGNAAETAAVQPNSINAFRFDRLYFCSRSLKEASERAGFRVNHADTIYPGIPTQQYVGEVRPASSPVNRFLIAMQLTKQSGLLTALQALEATLAQAPGVSLSVFGKGDSNYIAESRSYIAMKKLPVEFLPVSNMVRELPAIYKRHDALLHTAEWEEPYSSAPLEAMTSGLPVIASEMGGVQDVVRNGENALTYPAGDFAFLAQQMLELQQNAELRCKIAENGQQEVLSNYNESTVMDKIEAYVQTSFEAWAQLAV
ncbi:MAG TPA: glycosyltransferase family 4 protein [Candidatus Saccharimonadales bacterium]|nr:glycosyltransferase family 4 protein [Candidatus Saccharimonadales bacterium]